jgi:hypothetical protein
MIAGLLCLAVLTLAGGFGPPAIALGSPLELSPGQVVVAFGPELTGNPTEDFSHAAGTGDTVSVYVISGRLLAPAKYFSFGLGISESSNLKVCAVRSFRFAQVNSIQTDFDTIVRVAVSSQPICFDLEEQSVLAEVDLVRTGDEVPVRIQLGNFLYETDSPPEMESCRGAGLAFDDSIAQPLSVEPPVATPIAETGWTTIKSLYR